LFLHEIPSALVDRDLSAFFETNLSTIREERDLDDDWPGTGVAKRPVEISCGLFIWASIACRFIRDGKRVAMRRIDNLINGYRSGAGPEKQLDQIYTTVPKNPIGQDCDETEMKELYSILRQVLGGIVILRSPLSMESLAKLLLIPLGGSKIH
jgi:hypothetical protein